MKQNRHFTEPNNLPSIFTYIAMILVVMFSQERWDSWDLFIGALGICAFAVTFRVLHKDNKIEHLFNSLLLGLSTYVLLCASCILLGFQATSTLEPTIANSSTPLTAEQVEAILRKYLIVPDCALENWWWLIVFGITAVGFVFSTVRSKVKTKSN